MAERPVKCDSWFMETPQLTRVGTDDRVAVRPLETVPARRWNDLPRALATARTQALQLPVLRQGRSTRRLPETWEGVALRLQAALWEVAARSDIAVRPGASIDEVARLLVGHGAIIPPAGDAIRALAVLVAAGCDDGADATGTTAAEGARLAERLAGYLALRARFG